MREKNIEDQDEREREMGEEKKMTERQSREETESCTEA